MGQMHDPIGGEISPAGGPGVAAVGFVAELRRRGVLRAVLAYAVVAFAALQIVEPVLHGLRLPDWMLTVVVVAVGAGFPITIVVSWAFDLTLRGWERAAPASGGTSLRGSHWPLVAVTLAALFAGATASWLVLRNESRAPAGADGRVVVAVADFANETRDPDLDGLSEILVGWLEQSRSLRVLTRGRLIELLRQMGQEKAERIDEPLAREVGRRAGVRVLLLASIRRLGESYAVTLRAVDPEKDDYLFALPERAETKRDLFPLLERLSDRVRERLRERPAEVETSKVKVQAATRSFEAWQHYFRGLQEVEADHLVPALQSYRKAVAADPDFALAHYRIAYLGEFERLPAEERNRSMEAALRNIGSLPVKERMLVEAWKAHMDGRNNDAHGLYQRAATAFPDDKEVLYFAGDLYFHEQRWDDALPFFRKVAELAPGWDTPREHLFDCLYALRLIDEMQGLASTWVEKSPTPIALTHLALALTFTGQLDEAIAAGRRATEMDDQLFSRSAWGSALVLAERYEEAESVFRPLAKMDRVEDADGTGKIHLANALAYQGRRREALAVIESMPPDPDWKYAFREIQRMNLFFCVACRPPASEIQRMVRSLKASADPRRIWGPLYLAFYGDIDGAEELMAQTLAALPAPELVTAGGRDDAIRSYQANLAWRRGDKQRALAEATALWRQGPYWSRPAALYYLIVFAHDEGRDADLIALVDTLARTPSNLWRAAAYPETVYWAALAHERLGQADQARARTEKLLAMWKRADPDLPLLSEAKALCRRLGCRPPPR